jgi:hypothetical protein
VSWWDFARDVPIVLAAVYLVARPHGPLQLDDLLGTREEHDGQDREADETRAAARKG